MTATIAENDLDTDWLELLDFEHVIPCDGEDDKVASWKIILSCCGGTVFICQEHMDSLLEYFTDPDIFAMNCHFCQSQVMPPASIITLAERI